MRCRWLVCALLLSSGTMRAAAQDTLTTPSRPVFSPVGTPKSVTKARLIGIFPGAGHMYAGETMTGVAYLGGMFGVLLAGAFLMVGDCVGDLGELTPPDNEGDCSSTDTIGNLTTVAFVGLWGWSIYDAGRAARRSNVRRGHAASAIIAPTLIPSTHGRDRPGARIALRYTLP